MSLRLETERKYETIFILDPDLEEGVAQSAIEKIKGIITQGSGEILKVEDWGKRKLAYEVKKKSKGQYLLIHFSGSPALLSELERNFRVMDAVIKFQSIRLDERETSASTVAAPDDQPEEESGEKA
ncbi:MAG: 30S ribosomal protein S6 [Deltaproteobacteria bacterium]|jgi:small subunit ribosomal protein S6|nr:30S ribosomal protein S6 [Deltaproteobacteria bacterium]